jgi:hypothetical protein
MTRAVSALTVLAALLLAGCGGPVAHVVVAVRDEDGSAVTNVEVGVGTYVRRIPGLGSSATAQVGARTDTNGYARLTIPSRRGDLYLRMRPTEGFYYDRGIELRMTNAVVGRWQPWGQTNVLVVRRIVNPIPMYAMRFGGNVPVNGKPVGFDLMKGDWVEPYGRGSVPDFVFHAEWTSFGRNEHRHLRFDAKINLTFSNEGDGVFEVRIPRHSSPRGSVYRMPRRSPADGFTPRLSWVEYENDEGHSALEPEDLNYFIRVRTQRDATGNIVSGHYGKIHGPIQFWVNDGGATFQMTYYLNPTPNDLNTEFEPKRNLLKFGDSRFGDSRSVNEP